MMLSGTIVGRRHPECPARYAPGSISGSNSWPFVQFPGGTGNLLVSPSTCVRSVVRHDSKSYTPSRRALIT
ncbi:hypothetical protein J6590_108091, partial [Homalodisca vitripennis]